MENKRQKIVVGSSGRRSSVASTTRALSASIPTEVARLRVKVQIDESSILSLHLILYFMRNKKMKFFCPEMKDNRLKKIVKDMTSALIQKKNQVSLKNIW